MNHAKNIDATSMIMRLDVCILTLSILYSLVIRSWRGRAQCDSIVTRRRETIHVIASYRYVDAWRERVSHILASAHVPVAISVLLECDDHTQTVNTHDASDSILRARVHVECTDRNVLHPNAVLRRLVRRFVAGDETIVVHVSSCARLASQWTQRLHISHVQDGRVVSCPTPSTTGCARFPTLDSSDGTTRRGASRCIAGTVMNAIDTVPSVCWCPEVTVGAGETMRAWTTIRTNSFVDQVDQSSHATYTYPLLCYDDTLEDEMQSLDAGSTNHDLLKCERVGLTHAADGNERIIKYGSLFAARRAMNSVE